jgi:hypothetical protein
MLRRKLLMQAIFISIPIPAEYEEESYYTLEVLGTGHVTGQSYSDMSMCAFAV